MQNIPQNYFNLLQTEAPLEGDSLVKLKDYYLRKRIASTKNLDKCLRIVAEMVVSERAYNKGLKNYENYLKFIHEYIEKKGKKNYR